MTYKIVRLADCCIIKPPKSEVKNTLSDDDDVSFVPMKNLGVDTKKLILTENKKLSEVSGSYTYFAENDVLLAKITPCFENGKLGIATGLTNNVGFGSSEYIVFRSKGEVDPDYLYYYLLRPSFKEAGQAVMTGAVGHKRVPKDFIENIKIPLPPIPEQKRIVAILDQAFAEIDQARANAQQNLNNARELFESYLQQIFSQRGEGWEVKSLESFSSIVNGFSFKSGDFSPNNEVKSIKITNVGVYRFVEEKNNYLPKKFLTEYGDRYSADVGDIVVALTRTIISSGLKVAVVPASYDGALINQRVAAIKINEQIMPKEILQAFLSTKMAMDYVRSKVNELMQPNLSIKDLKAFPIPVPPKNQKLAVAREMDDMRQQINRLVTVYSSKLNDLDQLKKSILQKAFTGDLTKENKGVAA